jgi:SnoaL-like domain
MDPALRLLLDLEAIRRLKARYARLVDSRGWDELRTLFTEDAWAATPVRDYARRPIEEFVANLAQWDTGQGWIHHVLAPELDVVGDTAHGRWTMVSIHRPHHAPERTGEVVVHDYGEYEEDYRRGPDGEWRIASLTWRILREDVHPAETRLERYLER